VVVVVVVMTMMMMVLVVVLVVLVLVTFNAISKSTEHYLAPAATVAYFPATVEK
jgi:hypothetical protein